MIILKIIFKCQKYSFIRKLKEYIKIFADALLRHKTQQKWDTTGNIVLMVQKLIHKQYNNSNTQKVLMKLDTRISFTFYGF